MTAAAFAHIRGEWGKPLTAGYFHPFPLKAAACPVKHQHHRGFYLNTKLYKTEKFSGDFGCVGIILAMALQTFSWNQNEEIDIATEQLWKKKSTSFHHMGVETRKDAISQLPNYMSEGWMCYFLETFDPGRFPIKHHLKTVADPSCIFD